MPSPTRRTLLATAGSLALGALAGCSLAESEPPAGSLTFRNEDSLPHAVTMRVTDVGTSAGVGNSVTGDPTVPPTQREMTAATSLDAGESDTYAGVFTAPVWYAVSFAVDGRRPEGDAWTVTYTPAPDDSSTWRTLRAAVSEVGEFYWTISSTPNSGPFEE